MTEKGLLYLKHGCIKRGIYHPEMFCKKEALKHFVKFTRKHLPESLFQWCNWVKSWAGAFSRFLGKYNCVNQHRYHNRFLIQQIYKRAMNLNFQGHYYQKVWFRFLPLSINF